ncbi:hypothetical protein [Aliivibrio sifiae]|uniref:hypothetical protein n=1 Tax=Aliivibrio sifiae TaxID=566293 RepID=UPI003D151371
MKKKLSIDFDPTKRNFLAYSSLSTLAAIVGYAFIPKPVYAAMVKECKIQPSYSGLTLDDLDSINFYTKKTDALRCVGFNKAITFEQPVDEVQFISNVMFNEMVKSVFQEKYSTIANQIGGDILPNVKVLGMSDSLTDVYSLKNKHYDYIYEIMPEFIAQLIQGNYQDPNIFDQLSREERKNLNSWDMVSVNSSVEEEKSKSPFKLMMEDIYSLATSFATGSKGDKLHRYKLKKSDQWAFDLHEWYCEDGKIEACIDEMDVSKNGDESNYQNANSLITALGVLNRTSRDKGLKTLNDDQIHRFEETIYGAICLATSMSVKWGNKKETYSAVNNTDNIYETLALLRSNSTPEIQDFWYAFFKKYNEHDFVDTLREMNWENTSVYSDKSLKLLQDKYPEFIDPSEDDYSPKIKERKSLRSGFIAKSSDDYVESDNEILDPKMVARRRFRSKSKGVIGGIIKWKKSRMVKRIVKMSGKQSILAPSAIANTFFFLISGTHYVWATTASEEDQMGFSDRLGIGSVMFDTGVSIGYYAGVKAISKYMKKMKPASLAKATARFTEFSDFWLGAKNTQKLINRPITNIAHSIFNTSILAKLTSKVSSFLSAVGLYYAVDALRTAIITGNVADIIFEALNTTVASISFVLGFAFFQGMAFAGPLGIALVVIGVVLVIAKVIYDILKPKLKKLPPIAHFTNELLAPRGRVYKDTGYYLSAVKDASGFNYVKKMSLKTLDFIGKNNSDLELNNEVVYPRSIAASKENPGRIYSFERNVNDNYKYASFEDINNVSQKGFKNDVNWSKADNKIIRVIAAVENMSMYNDTYALFLCDIKGSVRPERALYLTKGLGLAPRSNDRITRGIGSKDIIQDIVVVDNERYPRLLAVSDRNLYQINERGYRANVIESDIFTKENRDMIENIELLSGGNIINLLVRYRQDNTDSKDSACHGQLYSLTTDFVTSNDYTNVVKGGSFYLGKDDQVICREYFHNSKKRLDFLVVGEDKYKRMGASLNDEENVVISFSEGLSLPSVGAISKSLVFKNAFVSF